MMGCPLPSEKKKKSRNRAISESTGKVQVQSGMILWRLGASFQTASDLTRTYQVVG